MRIASVQMNSTEDIGANVAKACAYVAQAAARGADLVVLPEFFNTTSFTQYRDTRWFELAEHETGSTMTSIREAARRHGVSVVATLYEKVEAGLYFDTAMQVDRQGEVVFKYRKTHPAGVLSLEKLYFRYGSRLDTYRLEDWRIGIAICYDMAFPETARSLAIGGAELLLAPYATPRVEMFQEMLRTRAFENGCFLAAANKVGQEGAWHMGGGSLIAGPDGAVLASADTRSEALLVADIDRARLERSRIAYPTRRDRRPDLYGAVTREVDADL